MRSLVGSIVDKAPVTYAPRGASHRWPGLGFGRRDDAVTQLRAMGSVGTLFSIVNRTSSATAAADWKLWRPAASGMKEDRTEVTSHAALDVWNKPNRFFTRQELVESVQQHVDLTGEGWPLVARNPRFRVPVELWFARPDRMAPVVSPTEFLTGYMYTSPDGEQVPLELDDVMQLRMPNPMDPYRGMGPVQSILTDLDSTRYSAEWNRNFFVNSAEPGGIIEVEKRLGDDEFEEMVTRWREQHQGVANAHRVGIIEQGKWVNRSFNMREMQFAELRGLSREIIREAFGMPKFMLGLDESVNRATAEASEVVFARWLTIPRLDRWKGMLNNDFLPMFGATAAGLEFDYVSPVPEDREADSSELTARATAAKALVEAGYDRREVLEAVGLPDIAVAATPSAPAVPPTPAAPPPADPAPATDNRQQILDPKTAYFWESPGSPLALAGPGLGLGLGLAIGNEVDEEETREDWEDRVDELLDDWSGISEAQRAELREQIVAAVNDGDTEALAALSVSTGDAAALLEAAMVAQAEAAAARMVAEAVAQGEAAVDVVVPVAELAATAAVVAAFLGAGLAMAAGREALRVWGPTSSGTEVADQVVEYLAGLSDAELRAQLGGAIWCAETTGRWAALDELPTALAYVASEIRDRNTCGPCREVDGTEWTDKADAKAAYPAGGYLDCDGRIRCRGTFEPVWKR